jgi:hypothetical protein
MQCDGDEGDVDGRGDPQQWPYLDFAFYARLYVVSAYAKSKW